MDLGHTGFSLGDLPTYLPNENVQPSSQKIDNEKGDEHKNEISEEEHLQNTDKEPVFIPGTNVCLVTEEDIKKWIAERRKNWPTRKNIEMKKKQEEEKRKRSRETDDGEDDDKKADRTRKRPKTVCKFYSQSKCKFGDKCKNSHESANGQKSSGRAVRYINNVEVEIPQRFTNEPDSSSLFRKLVKKDQFDNENDLVLEFIKFLDEKKLIDHDVYID